jgi:hypothetical protein
MQLIADNTTRFFTVVGAPYIPERHSDVGGDLEPSGFPHTVQHLTPMKRQTGSTGWLQDDC